MIIDQALINFIDALIIHDKRKVTTLNTDHNTLVSLLNTGYERIKWEKPKPKTWNFGTLDKQKFITTLAGAVASIDESILEVDGLNTAIIQATESTLQATAELNRKGLKPSTTPVLKELQSRVRAFEHQQYNCRQRMRGLRSQCEGDKQEKLNLKQQLQETKDTISDLLHQQLRAILQSSVESSMKMRKAMGALGKNSGRH